MCINSSDDQATSDINLVGFSPVPPEFTQISNVYNERRSAIGLLYLDSPGSSTVMCRYYLLGGDTAAPSGLYAKLCHAFLVLLSFPVDYQLGI